MTSYNIRDNFLTVKTLLHMTFPLHTACIIKNCIQLSIYNIWRYGFNVLKQISYIVSNTFHAYIANQKDVEVGFKKKINSFHGPNIVKILSIFSSLSFDLFFNKIKIFTSTNHPNKFFFISLSNILPYKIMIMRFLQFKINQKMTRNFEIVPLMQSMSHTANCAIPVGPCKTATSFTILPC